jgi:hypothetical protein
MSTDVFMVGDCEADSYQRFTGMFRAERQTEPSSPIAFLLSSEPLSTATCSVSHFREDSDKGFFFKDVY